MLIMILVAAVFAAFVPGDTAPANTAEPVLLYVSEAAKVLALSRARVYQMIAGGELPHVRFGKAVRIPRAALMRYIDLRTVNADTDSTAA